MRPATISHYSRILLLAILAAFAAPLTLPAQEGSSRTEMRIRDLEDKVTRLEEAASRPQPAPSTKTDPAAAGALTMVALLFGSFCALWAQNTNRSALLWFILGFFFQFFTVIILLLKNHSDRRALALKRLRKEIYSGQS
jgi:hypothetical protein